MDSILMQTLIKLKKVNPIQFKAEGNNYSKENDIKAKSNLDLNFNQRRLYLFCMTEEKQVALES